MYVEHLDTQQHLDISECLNSQNYIVLSVSSKNILCETGIIILVHKQYVTKEKVLFLTFDEIDPKAI